MAEPVENPSAMPGRISTFRRVRAWAALLLLCAVFLGMTWYGLVLLRDGLRPAVAWDQRIEFLLGGFGLLIPAWLVAKSYLLRRWQTGRWRRTRAEAVQQVTQCRTRTGGRAKAPDWFAVVYRWGNFSAFEPGLPIWRRVLGWVTLACCAIGFLLLAGFVVICFGAAFAPPIKFDGTLLFVPVGLLLAILPVMIVRWLLRHKRETGSFRVTRDDVEADVFERKAWEESERQKPLKAKLTSALVVVALLAWVWVRGVAHHGRHGGGDWVTPAMYTAFGAYGIWVMFRRPKGSGTAQS